MCYDEANTHRSHIKVYGYTNDGEHDRYTVHTHPVTTTQSDLGRYLTMENQDVTPEEQTSHSSELKKTVDRQKIPSFIPWALIAKEPKNVILGSSVYAGISLIFSLSLGSAGATMWNIMAASII